MIYTSANKYFLGRQYTRANTLPLHAKTCLAKILQNLKNIQTAFRLENSTLINKTFLFHPKNSCNPEIVLTHPPPPCPWRKRIHSPLGKTSNSHPSILILVLAVNLHPHLHRRLFQSTFTTALSALPIFSSSCGLLHLGRRPLLSASASACTGSHLSS